MATLGSLSASSRLLSRLLLTLCLIFSMCATLSHAVPLDTTAIRTSATLEKMKQDFPELRAALEHAERYAQKQYQKQMDVNDNLEVVRPHVMGVAPQAVSRLAVDVPQMPETHVQQVQAIPAPASAVVDHAVPPGEVVPAAPTTDNQSSWLHALNVMGNTVSSAVWGSSHTDAIPETKTLGEAQEPLQGPMTEDLHSKYDALYSALLEEDKELYEKPAHLAAEPVHMQYQQQLAPTAPQPPENPPPIMRYESPAMREKEVFDQYRQGLDQLSKILSMARELKVLSEMTTETLKSLTDTIDHSQTKMFNAHESHKQLVLEKMVQEKIVH